MKFQNVVALFATAASALAPPECKNSLPSYCRYTSSRDAHQCRQLFAQSYINIATCQLPAKTITSTRTNCVTSVTTKTLAPPPITKKIYKTTTKTGKPTTPPTVTVTATSTKIDTTTLTDSSTTTKFDTVTKTETDTITDTDTVTSTSTSTTFVPYQETTTCWAKKKKRTMAFGRTKKPLPTSCSCFLTTTQPAAVKTATVTKNKPAVTRTVYKFGGPRRVITRTIIIIRYVAGPTLSAPETTKTTTTTITQTDRTLTTVTDSQIETATTVSTKVDTTTSTSTLTQTVTATADPCADVDTFKVEGGSVSASNVVLSGTTDARGSNGPTLCCQSCYARSNCVFFRVGGGICEIFSNTNTNSPSCFTTKCPRGLPNLNLGSPDGKDYYNGACAGQIQA